jgi:hypothetical protein
MDTKTLLRIGLLILFLALLIASPALAGWQPDGALGLGRAADFAVLSLGKPSADTDGQSKLDLSAATIYGNVGVGPYGTLDFQGPSTIDGDLLIDRTLLPQDIISDEGVVTGMRIEDADLAGAVADALGAADENASLAPTQVVGRMTASTTVYGNGSLNVIAVDGIDFSRSSATNPLTLQLMGSDSDLFILNVGGKFVLGPSASIRGVDPGRVLVNVGPGQTPVQLASNTYVGATLLSVDRKMGPLQGASGPVIGACVSEISLVGGAVLNPPPAAPLAVIVVDTTVTAGSPVQLDGSASTSPYGDPLSYAWALEQRPTGSAATLSSASDVRPYFIADLPGDYRVSLTVSDGVQQSEPAFAHITAGEPGDAVDLYLAIDDDPDPVLRKQTVTYALSVTNQGSGEASDVEIDLWLDGDVRGTPVVDGAEACSLFIGGSLSCQLVDQLAAGATVHATLSATPKRPGAFSVEATVSSASPDPDPGDNTVVEVTTVLR